MEKRTCVRGGNSVTSVGSRAFSDCAKLANVALFGSLTSIVADAFQGHPSLKYACFEGNDPMDSGNGFANDFRITNVFYVPGTTGWKATTSAPTATVEMLHSI